ncbi:MAG: MFS transporter [Burkholderiales bacterium]|nr:MFS transporter [Burkholderiales bacterium]
MSVDVRSPAPRAGVLPFAAISLCYFGFIGLFSPYAPLWFQSLGYSTFAIGALTSMQSATRVLAPYAWGWSADHSGRREPLLRLAIGGALFSSFGFFLFRDYAWIAAVCVTLMLCTAGVVPISEAVLAHHVSHQGQVDIARYGRVRLWGSVGFVVVGTVSGFVLESAGVERFPLLCSGVLALLLLAAFQLPPPNDPAQAERVVKGALAVLREPVVAWFFTGTFFTVLAHTSLYAFYSLYLASLGYGKGAIGLLWSVGVAVEVAWFAFQGRWVNRLPVHGWLALAAGVSALRFAAIAAFASDVAVLVFAQLLHALTFAAQHSSCVAVLSRHFPGRLRSRGQALYTVLGYGASGVLGGVAGGALSERFGFPAVFWAASAVSLLAVLSCWRALVLDRNRS